MSTQPVSKQEKSDKKISVAKALVARLKQDMIEEEEKRISKPQKSIDGHREKLQKERADLLANSK